MMKEQQEKKTCATCHYCFHHPDGTLICNNQKHAPWVQVEGSCEDYIPSKTLAECIKQATPALSAAREAEGKCHGDMKKTVYISGSITDPQSGKPRDGWQKDFLEAEARLREIGFNVINPVDISNEVEDAFKWRFRLFGSSCNGFVVPSHPTRTDYIMSCLQHMKTAYDAGMLHGVYVIGKDAEVCQSIGVSMELHMATLLDIPIYGDDLEYVSYQAETSIIIQDAEITELLNE